ncbi:MAG: serine protease [Bermanella sp.]
MKTRLLQGLLLCVALISFVHADITPRIVGGEASGQSYSWMVSLQTLDGQHFCGGSLISSHWVVTAAHCTSGFSAEQIKVVVGIQNLNQPNEGETLNIRTIYNHGEYYIPDELDNDIALLRLDSDSVYSPIPTISESDFAQVNEGELLTAIGWGALESIDPELNDDAVAALFPNALQEVELPLVSPSVCRDVYFGLFQQSDQPLCAGYEDGGKDSCQGDSGGPLIFYIDETPYLVGVVSWGVGCGEQGYYGVYTNVSQYTEWLDAHLSDSIIDAKIELEQDEFLIGSGKNTTQTLTFTNNGDSSVTVDGIALQTGREYLTIGDVSCLDRQLAPRESCELLAYVNVRLEDLGNNQPVVIPRIAFSATSTVTFDLKFFVLEPLDVPFMSELDIDWFSLGAQNWFSPEGNCQLRSGDIDHSEYSVLLAYFDGTQAPIFDIEVDSEQDYDGLVIYMDEVFTGLRYSGNVTDQVNLNGQALENRDHRVMFFYSKDATQSTGEDKAAITAVEFEDVLISGDCPDTGDPRTEPETTPDSESTPADSDSSILGGSGGGGGGGAAFYLLFPLMLLGFRFSKAPHK